MIGFGLVSPKHSVNVAAVLRAAKCYGADFVVYTGRRYKRNGADTQNAVDKIPLFHAHDIDSLFCYCPYNCVPVAVDLVPGATDLVGYKHPKNAFYIFGPEDGTLGQRVLNRCRDTIYVPTNGCMNLAATTNVIGYDRKAKEKI